MVKQNRVQYSATKKKSAGSVKQSPTTSNTPPSNQPRNLLVTDATQPFALSFKGRYGLTTTIEVHQTPDEETWPGGALWDLGVLLAEVMIALALKAPVEVTTTVTTNDGRRSSARKTIQPPKRLVDTLQGDSFVDRALHKPCILELGAGVGLTGIVAASAMNASLALLTDLAVVVEGVTRGNVERNATVTRGSRMLTMQKGQVKIAAVPLCWGCTKDENAVRDMIEELDTPCRSAPVSRRKKKGSRLTNAVESAQHFHVSGMPSLVIIGDVAYQHSLGLRPISTSWSRHCCN